jgi:hypothetical protein
MADAEAGLVELRSGWRAQTSRASRSRDVQIMDAALAIRNGGCPKADASLAVAVCRQLSGTGRSAHGLRRSGRSRDARLFPPGSVSPGVGRPPARQPAGNLRECYVGELSAQGVVAPSPVAVTQLWVVHRAGLGGGFPGLVGSPSCLHVAKASGQATWPEGRHERKPDCREVSEKHANCGPARQVVKPDPSGSHGQAGAS